MELMLIILFSFLAFIFHQSSKQRQQPNQEKQKFGLPEIVRTLNIMLENGIITQKEYNIYLIRVNDYIK